MVAARGEPAGARKTSWKDWCYTNPAEFDGWVGEGGWKEKGVAEGTRDGGRMGR